MKDSNHYLINRLLDKINSDEEHADSYYSEETHLNYGCLVDEEIKQLIHFTQTYVN